MLWGCSRKAWKSNWTVSADDKEKQETSDCRAHPAPNQNLGVICV